MPGIELVYFIRALPREPVKIGWSSNVWRRFTTIETAHWHDLDIIGVMRGGRELEARLHRKFACFHIRGEWFRPYRSLLTYIEKHASEYDPAVHDPIPAGATDDEVMDAVLGHRRVIRGV